MNGQKEFPVRRMRAERKSAVAIVALLILAGSAFFWRATPKSSPLKLRLVQVQTEGTNGPEAIIHFTNESTSMFLWDLQTLVSSNGVWRKAKRQPKVDYPSAVLGRHGSWNHAVPVPSEAKRWKVELRCRRRETFLEDKVDDVFDSVGLRRSASRRPMLTNELVFEQ